MKNSDIIILNGKRLDVSPIRSGIDKMSVLVTPIQHCTGGSSQGNWVWGRGGEKEKRKKEKNTPDWKGRSKTISSFR